MVSQLFKLHTLSSSFFLTDINAVSVKVQFDFYICESILIFSICYIYLICLPVRQYHTILITNILISLEAW